MCGRYAVTKAVKKTKNIVQNNEGVEDTDTMDRICKTNFMIYPCSL